MVEIFLRYCLVSFDMIGIYLIINSINEKLYIGSSVNIEWRFYEHCYNLSLNKHKNTKLQAAWNFYGADAFHFCIVEECSIDKLLEIEQYWIDGSFGENCYNISPTAGNTLGKICSKETKLKISKANKGSKRTEEFKEQIRKNRKEHYSRNLKFINDWGLNQTPEAKEKKRLKQLGNQNNRKSDKWPHGCRCRCEECWEKWKQLYYYPKKKIGVEM